MWHKRVMKMKMQHNILKTGVSTPVSARCYCMTLPCITISFLTKGDLS